MSHEQNLFLSLDEHEGDDDGERVPVVETASLERAVVEAATTGVAGADDDGEWQPAHHRRHRGESKDHKEEGPLAEGESQASKSFGGHWARGGATQRPTQERQRSWERRKGAPRRTRDGIACDPL